jgi:ABC-type branched-subunit amino acid transport system ATPase component
MAGSPEKLRKEFGKLVAVRDVTITFPTSTVTCLLSRLAAARPP